MAGIDDLLGPNSAQTARIENIGVLRSMRKSPLLEQAWRYWTSLRRGHELPRRTALDPKEMGPILGHAMVLDRIRPGNVRIRLGGHVLSQLMGMEVRGLPVRAFFDLADRTRVMDQIEQVFETPATAELDLISDGADGVVVGRILVLPLIDGAGQITKALAVLAIDRIANDPPRRFQLTHSTLIPLAGAARRDPVMAPQRRATDHSLPVEIQAGMAEERIPFQGKPSNVPWLRVVK